MAPLEIYIKWHRKMWNWLADEAEQKDILYTKKDFIIKFQEELKKDFPDEYQKDIEESNNGSRTIYHPQCECFCCEFSRQFYDGATPCCIHCFLDWNSKNKEYPCLDRTWNKTENCFDSDGYFGLWTRCYTTRVIEDLGFEYKEKNWWTIERAERNKKKFIEYARIIAELPLREEYNHAEH